MAGRGVRLLDRGDIGLPAHLALAQWLADFKIREEQSENKNETVSNSKCVNCVETMPFFLRAWAQ